MSCHIVPISYMGMTISDRLRGAIVCVRSPVQSRCCQLVNSPHCPSAKKPKAKAKAKVKVKGKGKGKATMKSDRSIAIHLK